MHSRGLSFSKQLRLECGFHGICSRRRKRTTYFLQLRDSLDGSSSHRKWHMLLGGTCIGGIRLLARIGFIKTGYNASLARIRGRPRSRLLRRATVVRDMNPSVGSLRRDIGDHRCTDLMMRAVAYINRQHKR